jgi:hypothetical protein
MTEKKIIPRGRPSIYSDELIDSICERIMMGESLNRICKDKAMPSYRTVCYWLRDKPDFLQKYTCARVVQMHLLADSILEIADDGSQDTVVNDKGHAEKNTEWITRTRLKLDTRKWLLAKLLPRIYGDKVNVTTDGEKLTRIEIEIIKRGERDNIETESK